MFVVFTVMSVFVNISLPSVTDWLDRLVVMETFCVIYDVS